MFGAWYELDFAPTKTLNMYVCYGSEITPIHLIICNPHINKA